VPQSCDMGPSAVLPLRRKACLGFFCPKNPTASAGFEPANLGTRATSLICLHGINRENFLKVFFFNAKQECKLYIVSVLVDTLLCWQKMVGTKLCLFADVHF
jgi:hypothetical protein